LTCAENEYNSIAALVFTTPEKSLHALFHDPPDSFGPASLYLFLPYIFGITCITFGLSVPAGLFIPALLIGATWGRIIGFPNLIIKKSFINVKHLLDVSSGRQLLTFIRLQQFTTPESVFGRKFTTLVISSVFTATLLRLYATLGGSAQIRVIKGPVGERPTHVP
ncbi:unnamed protein product, partial [Dibothriocephalus latus]